MKYIYILYYLIILLICTGLILCIFLSVFNIVFKDKWKWKNNRLSYAKLKQLEFVGKVFGIAFGIILIWVVMPYWKDFPLFITSKFNYIEGYPTKKVHRTRDFSDYVVIDGVELDFAFSSRTSYTKRYKVTYLPYTKSVIDIIEIK